MPFDGFTHWTLEPQHSRPKSRLEKNPQKLGGHRIFFPQTPTDSIEKRSLYGASAPETIVGRYIEHDPLGLNGGLNIYGYAAQNPTQNIDPLGLLKYNSDGSIYFIPVGSPVQRSEAIDDQHSITKLAQDGYVMADDGTLIPASQTLESYPFATQNQSWTAPNPTYDCHGMSFGDSQVVIGNPQVADILQHDNYNRVYSPNPGDVAVYVDESGITHSTVVSSVDAVTGAVTVAGKAGILPAPEITPVDAAWPGAAVGYWRKGQ